MFDELARSNCALPLPRGVVGNQLQRETRARPAEPRPSADIIAQLRQDPNGCETTVCLNLMFSASLLRRGSASRFCPGATVPTGRRRHSIPTATNIVHDDTYAVSVGRQQVCHANPAEQAFRGAFLFTLSHRRIKDEKMRNSV